MITLHIIDIHFEPNNTFPHIWILHVALFDPIGSPLPISSDLVKLCQSPEIPSHLSHAAARAKWLILLRDASGTQNRPGRRGSGKLLTKQAASEIELARRHCLEDSDPYQLRMQAMLSL